MAKNKKDKKKNKNKLKISGSKSVVEMSGGHVLEWYTEHTNKNGKLINLSKKEKKEAKYSCPHNRYTNLKKRKKKFFVRVNDKKQCRCKICGEVWDATFFTQEAVKKRVDNTFEVVTQMQFLNQAIDGGENTTNYLSAMGSGLKKIPNYYGKMVNIASKQEKAKKQKNKEKRSSLGYWDTY